MCGLVDVVVKRRAIGPNTEIHDHLGVRKRPETGGIITVTNEPPHEPVARFGQRVDLIEGIGKLGNQWIIDRRA